MSEILEFPVKVSGDSHLLTVMIADIRGYSKFTHEMGDEAGARLAAAFAGVAREVVRGAGGTVLELRGDEALAVFPSARRAARAAVDLQVRSAESADADDSLPLHIGIGLDAGDVVPVEDGYRGRALNVAARLCALAGPGETYVGESLVHLAGVVDDLMFVSRGGIELKGVGQVRAYQLGRSGDLPEHLPPLQKDPSGALPGEITGYVAGGIGIAAVFIDLLFNSVSFGFLVRAALAVLVCMAGIVGARLARVASMRGLEWIFFIAAFVIVLTLGWIAAIPAILFLIAAGLVFFGAGSG